MKPNKFYMPTDKEKYSERDIVAYRKGNNYVLFILELLVNYKGDISKFKKEYKRQYLSLVQGALEMNVINSNGCIDKLTQLVIALEKNPKNAEIFLKSPLVTRFILPIVKGSTELNADGTYVEGWENYVRNFDSGEKIKGASMFDKGMACYIDSDCEIGLDLAKVLDTLVQKDANGKYVLNNTTTDALNLELTDAAQLQLNIIRNSSKFKRNFNEVGDIANEDENEDE